ncbi:hypothetical protein EON65_02340 [archaeon]|nr:MAG: hypothetical protein EON65_02340 [archaeon]
MGHTFFFTDIHDKSRVLSRHTMSDEQVLYVIEDPDTPAPQDLKQDTEREVQFMEDYFNRTGETDDVCCMVYGVWCMMYV